MGAGWARNEWPGAPAQDVRDASCEGVVRMAAQDQDSRLVCDRSTLVMFLETRRHKEAQTPGRGALGTNALGSALPSASPQDKRPPPAAHREKTMSVSLLER